MGVVNITPDSFSDGGHFLDPGSAIDRALKLAEAGADILDLGGESSRPGARPVPAEIEIERVAPVLQKLRPATPCVISIDTYKPEVARVCLELGADAVNDITALRFSPEMALLAARFGAGLVLMHMRGMPENMQELPASPDILAECRRDLEAAIAVARQAGVEDDRLILDPGIGFGKTFEENLVILNRLSFLESLRLPVLVGPSRKGFLGRILNKPGDQRLMGTVAAVVTAVLHGAHIVRVHDVMEVRQAVDVVDAIIAETDRKC